MKDLCNLRLFYWIARRRGLLTVFLFLAALAGGIWGSSQPVDFLGPDRDPVRWLPWLLTCAGVCACTFVRSSSAPNKKILMEKYSRVRG